MKKKLLICFAILCMFVSNVFAVRLPAVPKERCITINKIREDGWISEHDAEDNRINFIIQKLIELDRTPGDIRIYLYSPGGHVRSGLGLIDIIMTLRNDVQVLVQGEASSMALYILAVGTKGKRVITKHTEIYVHRAELAGYQYPGSIPFWPFLPAEEPEEDGKEWTEEEQEEWWEDRYIQDYVKEVEMKCDEILFEHSKVTQKELAEWDETFIYTDDILKYEIADGIYEGEIE